VEELLRGNQRFQRGTSVHVDDRLSRRLACARSHTPRIAVLSCADARVDPDVVFDAGLGEVFSVRVAGTLASEEAIASLRYAVDHLGVHTVVVLGHDDCGAVAAATAEQTPSGLDCLLGPIRRALAERGDDDPVVANTLSQAGVVGAALGDRAEVVAAVYEPGTGAVHVHERRGDRTSV
jgi:carbonic anhydrase